MINMMEAHSQEALKELNLVLEKCRNCTCLVTLRQSIRRPDGEYNFLDLQNTAFDVKCTVNANEDFLYLTLKTNETAELKRLKSLWETMLNRGKSSLLAGKPNDYLLSIDCIHQELERGIVYILAFEQPVFLSDENASMLLVFKMNKLTYGKEAISLEEIEYEEAVYNMTYGEGYENEPYETDEETPEETEDFISTDEYTNV